jgi:hypothetical protein
MLSDAHTPRRCSAMRGVRHRLADFLTSMPSFEPSWTLRLTLFSSAGGDDKKGGSLSLQSFKVAA